MNIFEYICVIYTYNIYYVILCFLYVKEKSICKLVNSFIVSDKN